MAKGSLSRHAIAVGAVVLMAGTMGLTGFAEAQFGGGQPSSGGARSGPSAGGAARGDGGGMRRGGDAGDVRGNRGGGSGRSGDGAGMFGGGRSDGARGPSAGSGRASGPRGPIVVPQPGPVVSGWPKGPRAGGGSTGPSHGSFAGPRRSGGWAGPPPPLPPRHRPRPPGVSFWYWSGIPIFATDYDGCGYEYYKWRSTGSSYWRRMYFECRDEDY